MAHYLSGAKRQMQYCRRFYTTYAMADINDRLRSALEVQSASSSWFTSTIIRMRSLIFQSSKMPLFPDLTYRSTLESNLVEVCEKSLTNLMGKGKS